MAGLSQPDLSHWYVANAWLCASLSGCPARLSAHAVVGQTVRPRDAQAFPRLETDLMYLPPQFRAKDEAHALALMHEHPFATLISSDDDGMPFATHLPLHLEERAGQGGANATRVLLGHVARPNPHWRFLRDRPRALVTFLGPHAYLSPRVYPDLARVPTWNYVAVHCTVQASLVEDALAKDRLLKKLIGDHEPSYAQQWRDLGEEYAHKMLAGIVAFELEVTAMECKIKVNQHRPEAHQRMLEIYDAGDPQQRGVADWMRRIGLGAS